jgi:hypothetical protein
MRSPTTRMRFVLARERISFSRRAFIRSKEGDKKKFGGMPPASGVGAI